MSKFERVKAIFSNPAGAIRYRLQNGEFPSRRLPNKLPQELREYVIGQAGIYNNIYWVSDRTPAHSVSSVIEETSRELDK